MLGHRPLEMEDFVAILKRRRYWVLVPAILGPLLGLLSASILPKQYTSKTTVLVEGPKIPADYVKPIVNDDLGRRLSTMQEQILSRSRLIPVIERLGLFKQDAGKRPIDDLVERLRKNITVAPVQTMASSEARGIQGFVISYIGEDPKTAQQVCSEVTSMFIGENVRYREQSATGTTEFISDKLADAKKALDDKDARLADFKRKYMGQLPEQEAMNLQILNGMRAQLEGSTETLHRASQDKAFAQSMLSQQIDAMKAAQEGKNPMTLEEQLSKEQDHLRALEARGYLSDHPDVVALKREITQLRKRIDDQNTAAAQQPAQPEPAKAQAARVEPPGVQQLRTMIHQYDQTIENKTKEIETLQEQIRLYQSRVQMSPLVEQEYKDLTRDYQTALDFYNDLLRKRDSSEMAQALERRQEGGQFRVLDPPSLPEKPSFPQRSIFGLGGLGGGLALGLGLAVLLEMLDKSLHTERDVQFVLQTNALAVIPYIAARNGHTRKAPHELLAGRARMESEPLN